MRHLLKISNICIVFLLSSSIGFAADCKHSIESNMLSDFQKYVVARDSENYENANLLLANMAILERKNFCILYEQGRMALIQDKNEIALKYLTEAREQSTSEDLKNQPIYNIIGYTYLVMGNLEDAELNFAKQVELPEFPALVQSDRMKTHNNHGLTLLKLDRYEEALSSFEKAIELGSSLAQKNIEIVKSIITVRNNPEQEGQPGIFGVSVYSARKNKYIQNNIKKFAAKIGLSTDAFQVFSRPNGMLTITYGAFLSYPDALKKLQEAKSFSKDANIISVADWQNVAIRK